MAGPEERGGRVAGGSGEAQAQGQPRDSAMAPIQPSLGPPRDEPRVFGLDKFNDDNFAEWSFKMENIFDHYDLLEVMEGTEKRPENDPEKSPWVRKSAQGYLLLGQALGSSQIRHIKPFQREPEKGPKAWAALKGVHAPATAAVAVVLERQMAALRIEEDETKTKLLALLPESWSSLIINLNRDLPHLSLEDVKRAILQEDFRRRELASADGAGAASIGRRYGRGRGRGRGGSRFGSNNFNGGRGSGRYGGDNKSYGRGRGRFNGECHYCHKSGHMWHDCFKLPDGWTPAQGQEGRGAGGGRGRGRGGRGGRGGGAASMKSTGNESESRDDRFPGQFFFVSTQESAGPEKDEGFEEPAAVGKVTLHSLDYWVIDSGATYSMTPRADLLTELEPSPVKHVTSALGQRAEVKGMGKAMFKGADGKMVGLKNPEPSRPTEPSRPNRAAQPKPSRAALPEPSRAALPEPSRAARTGPSRPTCLWGAPPAITLTTTMASPPVLAFDAEGRPVKFETWLDDLHLFLQLTAKEDISLYDHALGHATAPAATVDSTARSQWQTRDAHARFAIRNSLPIDEREHFGQHKTAQELYTAVVARYSSPASAALGCLSLPYLFPDLASFHTVADLITHLRTSEARFRAAMPDEFLAKNPPPLWLTLYHLVTRLPDTLRSVRDHFLARCPTELTIALLEKELLAAEASIVAVGASRGDPRSPFFEGCSPSPLLPSVASAAAVHLLGTEKVGIASALSGRRSGKGKGGKGGGGDSGGGGGGGGGGAYCAEHGIEQSFTLPASPQQNGIAERRIGLVMEVARTSLIHAAAPHFLWPFAVRYAAHQLNLWPRVSLPETSPTVLWIGEVGDASRFRVWGSRAFVRDMSADKLSSRAVPCLFLGFVPDAPGWEFYHATSRRVLPSQDVTFDKSVPYYRLFPYRTAPLPPPPLFLTPGATVVDPLPPQGAGPSGVSQVDPVEPVEVAIDSRPTVGAEPGGAEPGGAEPGGEEPGGTEPGGAEPGGEEPGGAEPGGTEPGGAESGGEEPGGAEPGSTEPGGAEPQSPESRGSESGGPKPEGPAPGGALSSEQLREWYFQYCSLRRGTSGAGRTTGTGASASPPSRELPSRERICEWYERRCTLRSGAPGVADPAAAGGATGARDSTGSAGAAAPEVGAVSGAVDPGVGATAGAADPGAGAAAGAEDPGVGAAAGTADPGVGAAAGAEDPGAGAAAGAVESGVGAPTGAEDPNAGVSAGSRVAARQRPYFVPLLQQVLGLPPSLGPPPPLECPQPVQSRLQLQTASTLPAPSPYTGPTGGLAERRAPASRPVSPVRTARTSGCGSRQRPPPVPGMHRMSLRPSTAPLRAPLPSPPESSLPALPDPDSDSLRTASPTVTRLLATVITDPSFASTAASALVAELVDFAARSRLDYAASLVAESESVCPPSFGGECALGTDVLEDRQEEFQCLAAASPHLVSVLLTPEGDSDALDIPTPRSYAEVIEGPYSSQWQAAMDAEMASSKSTGTYVDTVPPPGANIVSGMWIFGVKRPPGSPPVFKARYVARGFSQRQGVDYFQTFSPTPKMTTLRVLLHVAAHRDYELHSLDFSTAFLQGSLHEEIWLRRPPGFTGSFPPGTQWSLRRPVYGLRQAPREWHDTLRTTLAALGFAPSTADPSLFLRTDTSLLPFYILVYVDDLVFATADTAGLAYVKSELQKRHTCTNLGELRSYLGLQITRDRARRTITLTQSHMVQQVLQRFGFTYSSP
ncbi:unnamed protein product [Closterium sp. NIES-54]